MSGVESDDNEQQTTEQDAELIDEVYIRSLQAHDPINNDPEGTELCVVPDGDRQDTRVCETDDGEIELEIEMPVVAKVKFDEALTPEEAVNRAAEVYFDDVE